MPHGLTIDYEGNFWFTDVALHQVFKYDFSTSDEPLLSLGKAFENGDDEKHFCKPTSVSVSKKSGDIFVADGYCNNRVVQFDKDGKYVKQFEDKSQPLVVVHSIALVEILNLICTVSREEGR
jgi:peptidylglycine monooxygenase / peptidylamidoglycolate lyase